MSEMQQAPIDESMTVFTNLSRPALNAYASLWITSIQAHAKISYLRIGQLLGPSSGDVVHLHWLENYYPSRWSVISILRITWLVTWMTLLRICGVVIVVTMHNLHPHDRTETVADSIYWLLLPYLIQGFVVHSNSGLEELLRIHPNLERIDKLCVKHPLYPPFLHRTHGVIDGALDDKSYIASVGTMRPYKQIGHLLDAYEEAATACREPISALYLGGSLSPQSHDIARRVRDLQRAGLSISAEFRQLNREEMEQTMREALFVATMHIPSIASGMMMHVISVGGRLLAPRCQLTENLQTDFGANRILLYEFPLSWRDLKRATDHFSRQTGEGIDPPDEWIEAPDEYSWTFVAEAHVDFYRKLLTLS